MIPEYSSTYNSLRTLVELGTKGFFPLFDHSWIEEIYQSKTRRLALTAQEKKRVKEILTSLAGHQALDKKKTIVFSLKKAERQLLIREFLKMVERRILDEKPRIQ